MITIKLGLMENVEAINKHKIDAIIRSALMEEGYNVEILGAYEDESGQAVTTDFSVDDMNFMEKAIAGAVKKGFDEKAVEQLFTENSNVAIDTYVRWVNMVAGVENPNYLGEDIFNEIIAEELGKYLPKVA